MKFKTYDKLTDDDVNDMVASWHDEQMLLARHVIVWLTEHDFDWDHDKSDDANRDAFDKLCDRVFRLFISNRLAPE